MRRRHKSYEKPKRPFEAERLKEEAEIKKKFGLKNKKEIWKAESKINSMRGKAKNLISSSSEEQQALFDRLKRFGLNVNSIADVLSLTKEDYLKRRLQTVLVDKKLANTTKQSRQLITHKKVLVNGGIIDSPSYIVPTHLENKISLKINKPKKIEKNPQEDSKEKSEKADEELEKSPQEEIEKPVEEKPMEQIQ